MALVILNDKLHQRVKVHTALNKLTIKEFVENSVLRVLEENEHASSVMMDNSKQKRKKQQPAKVA